MSQMTAEFPATSLAGQDFYVQNSGTKAFHLSTGEMTLSVDSAFELDLIRLAERQNPKRAFLFVSTVLGRHIPVVPGKHRRVMKNLAAHVSRLLGEEPLLVMGYAETAIGIGAIMADSLRRVGFDALYLPTTRHVLDGESWFTLNEEHSHATQHHVMSPPDHPAVDLAREGNGTLVLVDDETTTGSTFAELVQGLVQQGLSFKKIILATLTDWSGGRCIKAVQSLCPKAEVNCVSLLYGTWDWEQNELAPQQQLPDPVDPVTPLWHPRRSAMETPRLGEFDRTFHPLNAAQSAGLPQMGLEERILVVGTGEYVWEPFLLAEALEGNFHDVSFIATTRSPVLIGETIRKKATFSDHFGLGLEMYLHNVDPSEWDRIIVMTETGPSGICQELRAFLKSGSAKIELLSIGEDGNLEYCELS